MFKDSFIQDVCLRKLWKILNLDNFCLFVCLSISSMPGRCLFFNSRSEIFFFSASEFDYSKKKNEYEFFITQKETGEFRLNNKNFVFFLSLHLGSFLIGILFLSLVAIAVFIRVETNKSSTIMIMDTAASSSSSSKTTTTMTSNRNKNSMIENNSKIKNNNNKNERNHQNVNNNGAIILASLLSSSPSRLSSSSPSNVEPNPTTLQMVNSLLMEDVDSFNNNKINNSKKREIQPPTTIETIEKRKINETNPILYSEAKYLPSSTINLAEQKNPNEMINNNNKSTTLQSIVIPTQRIIIEMDIKVTKPIITQNNNNNDDSDNVNDDDNNNSSS